MVDVEQVTTHIHADTVRARPIVGLQAVGHQEVGIHLYSSLFLKFQVFIFHPLSENLLIVYNFSLLLLGAFYLPTCLSQRDKEAANSFF